MKTLALSSLLMLGPLLSLPAQTQACDIVTSSFGSSSFVSSGFNVQSFVQPQTIIQQQAPPVIFQQAAPVVVQQAAPVILQQQVPVVVENRIRVRKGLFGRRNNVNVNVSSFGTNVCVGRRCR